jgi:indolepyruvate ferredoxin oxidoreductase
MFLAEVTLDDKYALSSGRVFLTGTQALVRLPIMQQQRDVAEGLNTAGFISGYRGSPLGAYDQQLWRARTFLEQANVRFEPGLNEDLAATAIWGTQQCQLFGDSNFEGVFGIWYGKGPGVDRSGDVLRHANLAGTANYGGVLCLAGDDHICKSSTTAHQSEYAFVHAMMPVLHPASVQELLDLGLHGIAMSRYCGAWVAFKILTDTVDTSTSVYVDPDRISIALPDSSEFDLPPGGLNIRHEPVAPLEQEERLHRFKLEAARAYCRKNNLDRTIVDSPAGRLGIVTCGNAYLGVMQALADLGINAAQAGQLGLKVHKVAMTWPLEPEGIRAFATGLEELLVIEEKRGLVESQLKEQLYDVRHEHRPRIVGKHDEYGKMLLPAYGELATSRIAQVIVQRLKQLPGEYPIAGNARVESRLEALLKQDMQKANPSLDVVREPYFCSGCPHNTSTKIPQGSTALAGIGCHYMAQWMDRNTVAPTHMGGEGATWIGRAPFATTRHVFVNMGDGTYQHSGLLAIRAAVAAKVNVTYKILFNDAVAMTGGQPLDGMISVPSIARQVSAEGVKNIVVATDEPEKYSGAKQLPHGVTVQHRNKLDRIQRQLRETDGCTVLIYDQVCAAEKRRRRKRGTYPDPPKRVFINELVCEGCGDCSIASNCLSIVPQDTVYGRKRRIDQASCNTDFSCIDGFCPSFVTVHGATVRKPMVRVPFSADALREADRFSHLPNPRLPSLAERPYGILVTGIGGTGIVTIGAILGMAAHLESKGCSVLDMAGLAQKGGPVTSHIRIAQTPDDIHCVKLSNGGADLLLASDMIVASCDETLCQTERTRTAAVINEHQAITGDFTRDPDWIFPMEKTASVLREAVGSDKCRFVNASKLATALVGDSMATNMIMLGYAFQEGLIPLSAQAIEKAIELNGVATAANIQAFFWGRLAAQDMGAVEGVMGTAHPEYENPQHSRTSENLDEIIESRIEYLTHYQNARYATRYRDLVHRVSELESQVTQRDSLAHAVARYYFKLLAYKDEYEVARLYTSGQFLDQLRKQFEGNCKIRFHLAPPLFARRDEDSGYLLKQEFGSWVFGVFKVLAKLKFLRGTKLDVFGYTQERKQERRLIADYEDTIGNILGRLNRVNHDPAVELAELPERIRGFGHVKRRHISEANERKKTLLQQFRNLAQSVPDLHQRRGSSEPAPIPLSPARHDGRFKSHEPHHSDD